MLAYALNGVTLANCLLGESTPEYRGLFEDELCRKEAIVFDLAIGKLCGNWNYRIHDRHLLHAHKVRCLESEMKCSHSSLVEEYVKASEQKVRESGQLNEIRSSTSSYATMSFRQLTTVSLLNVPAQRAVRTGSIQLGLQSSFWFFICVVAICSALPQVHSQFPLPHLP